jgi:hypothetical protein
MAAFRFDFYCCETLRKCAADSLPNCAEQVDRQFATATPISFIGLATAACDRAMVKIASENSLMETVMARIDIEKFVSQLRRDALPPYGLGRRAKFVRLALEHGGAVMAGHPVDAKDWGPTLVRNGFRAVAVRHIIERKRAHPRCRRHRVDFRFRTTKRLLARTKLSQ